MEYLYVCNTSKDCITMVSLKPFFKEKQIKLKNFRQISSRVGPHGICNYKNVILCANNYNNTVSIIDKSNFNNIESYYIGSHCNDVKTYDNKAYIVCGDCNNIVLFDLVNKNLVEQITCGNLPHSIEICKSKKILAVANMQSDSVTLLDCENMNNIKNIKVGAYPTKVGFSIDGNYLMVCESNIGTDGNGCINIISLKTFTTLSKIEVGKTSVDFCYDKGKCIVSNFGEGSISIVDIEKSKEISKIIVGGMPRGIVQNNGNVYIGDNYRNLIMKVNIFEKSKKAISIGGEPNGIILA